jgi:tetraacyldisaccharide 4'-kinase
MVTNAESGGLLAVAETLRRHNPRAPIVVAEYHPVECFEVTDPTPYAPAHAPDALRGRRLLAFAGIARPESFRLTVERLGARLTGLVEFPDHHWYRTEDLATIARQAEVSGAEGLVTTEKDYVRLSAAALHTLPIWVLSVRLAITEGQAHWREAFERVLHR